MLIGQYSHTIDAKGRLNMPSKFRTDLGERFFVTKGLDNCLFVYSQEEWEKLQEKIREQPISKAREVQRFFFSGAIEAEVDKQGRILIPIPLRDHAFLVKDITIIGALNRAEIWDTALWNQQASTMSNDKIASVMDELGF